MNCSCEADAAVRLYRDTFYCILDEMIYKMTSAKLKSSISYNFIVQMIPHHQAAIEMSENVLKFTKNQTLRRIAENIIREQTKSIENMERMKRSCSMRQNCREDLCGYQNRMEQIMQAMFREMEHSKASDNINCNFMREMIPHHEGAVKMSENTLQYNICPELTPILKAIISSQERGIAEMKRLERCIGCDKA